MRQAFGFAAKAREGPDTQALLTCTEKEDSQEARTEDQVSLGRKCLVFWLGTQRWEVLGTGASFHARSLKKLLFISKAYMILSAMRFSIFPVPRILLGFLLFCFVFVTQGIILEAM